MLAQVSTQFMSAFNTLPNTLLYLAVGLLLTAAFLFIYEVLTPLREMEEVRDGNAAVAYAFGGALIGFALPLVVLIRYSASVTELVVWGVLIIAIQYAAYWVAMLLYSPLHWIQGGRQMVVDLSRGQTSTGIYVASVVIVVGAFNAACLVPA